MAALNVLLDATHDEIRGGKRAVDSIDQALASYDPPGPSSHCVGQQSLEARTGALAGQAGRRRWPPSFTTPR